MAHFTKIKIKEKKRKSRSEYIIFVLSVKQGRFVSNVK